MALTDLNAALGAAELPYGGYLAWWPLIPLLIILLFWARLLTWIDKDCKKALLPREMLGIGNVGGMALAVLLFFFLPGGPGLAIAAVAVVFLIEMGVYLGLRGSKIGLADLQEELVPELTFGFAGGGGSGGDAGGLKKKKKKGAEDDFEVGDVTLIGKGGSHIERPDEEDPNRIGFDTLLLALADPLTKGAQTIEMIPSGETQAVRYHVDGVAYDGSKIDRATANEAISFLKQTVGLDANERRKPQAGAFKIITSGSKKDVRVTTAGSSAGETARLEVDVPARYMRKPADLGLNSDQLDFLMKDSSEGGVVLLAAPRGHGLTALQYAMVRMHDAFTSHILTIERDPPIDLEGITQTKLAGGASPAEEVKTVDWVASQLPDILMAGGIETPQAAQTLINFARDGRRVYVGIRAGGALEAIDAWRKLVGDDELALKNLHLVIAGRLFRRLCDATKIPYAPDPAKLRQLGMAGGIEQLYRPNFGPLRDARGNEIPDTYCFGLGYQGRFGVYETLLVDEEVRSIYASGANASALRGVFRKQKRRYIQELALARVEAGDTSVEEFIRVLKPETSTKTVATSKPAKSG
jgi:type II secretory ATPase GspE/PulE/Tfp pilus assembly ATPase PilB-like protein